MSTITDSLERHSSDSDPSDSDPRASHARIVAVLTGVAAFGLLASVPISGALSAPGSGNGISWRWQAIGLLVHLLFIYFLIQLGLKLGRHIGMGAPILAHLLDHGGQPYRVALPTVFRNAFFAGAIVGVLVATVGVATEPLLPPPKTPVPTWSPWEGFLGAVGAGITEELMFRLGLMTFFAWLGVKLLNRREPPVLVIWTANALAAIAFGLAHLPLANMLVDQMTGLFLFHVISLNAAVGLVCGWLFWRYGILAAMVAHFSTNIVLKVLWPLFFST